jgi:cytochrome c553
MKKVLRWTGAALGALVVLLIVAYGVLYARSQSILTTTWDIPGRAVTVVPDSAALARAEHYVHSIYGCANCHGEDLAGGVFLDEAPGRFVASNLTPGGVGATYTDADWDRAIRHGLRPDGTPLIIMGAERFSRIPDEDFAALLAYLKARPAVENDLPEERLRPLGRFLIGAGVFVPAALRLDHEARPPAAIEPDTTAEYGRYLVSISCVECHQDDLQGGASPDPAAPPVPSLAAAARWSPDEFVETIRTGTTPGGRVLQEQFMPWPEYARLSDAELRTMHRHLQAALAGVAVDAVASN